MYQVLLIDDDYNVQKAVSDFLNYKGYTVKYTASGREALKMCSKQNFDAVLLDLKLLDISGLEVLQGLIKINPSLPVIVISDKPDIVLDAVQAVKSGA